MQEKREYVLRKTQFGEGFIFRFLRLDDKLIENFA
jgi:hypothetical protein